MTIPYLALFISFWIGFLFNFQSARWISYAFTCWLLVEEEVKEFAIEGPLAFFSSIWNYFSCVSYW